MKEGRREEGKENESPLHGFAIARPSQSPSTFGRTIHIFQHMNKMITIHTQRMIFH